MTHLALSRFAALTLTAGLALSAGGAALAQTKIVVRTDFKFNGYVSPLALAIEKGFYKDAGFDVSIEQGQGSSTTVQTVASGVDHFGLADSATAVLGISAQNVPVKIVAVYNQTGTMGLIYHPDSGFTGDLASIKGKVMISSAGSADAKMLEPTLATAGLKLDDVNLQLVDINARVPLFLQTPGAFLTGFATGDLLRVRSRLPGAKSFKDTGRVLAGTRNAVAWAALGHATAAYEIAVAYCQQRQQFGKPLSSFQIVQDRLVKMLAEVCSMQLYCLRLGRLIEEGSLTDTIAAIAKMNNTRKARQVIFEARDLLGGNGILLDFHVMRHMADIEAIHTYEGTETIQTLIVGRDITGASAFT